MSCQLVYVETLPSGKHRHRCSQCERTIEVRAIDATNFRATCGQPAVRVIVEQGLSEQEKAELFPADDPTLIGNRIAAMTDAIGIPPCGGCKKRKEWMNRAHVWLKAAVSGPGS